MFMNNAGGFSTPFMSRILLVPDGDCGGSGGNTDEKPPKREVVEEVVKKHGSENAALLWAMSKIHDLEKDNHGQREEIRITKGQLPKDGSRVISAEEASAFDAYRAFGKPEDIGSKLKEREKFEGDVKKFNREKEIKTIASSKSLGWDADVLNEIAGDAQFVEIEEKDAKGNTVAGEDGKPKKIWAVKAADDKEPPIPAKEKFSKFLPALVPAKTEDKNITPSRDFKRADSSPASGEKPKFPSLVK